MSHHPTTAELAAFRRDEARITFGTLDPNEYDPSTLAYRVLDSVTRSLYPGAWPDERRDGIGLGPEPWDGAEDRWGSNVRREASALRSRAFARMARPAHPDVPMTPAEYDALRDAVRAFAPTW